MKKLLILLLPAMFALISWNKAPEANGKEWNQPGKQKVIVRYEFSADVSSLYGLDTQTNQQWSSEQVFTSHYSRAFISNSEDLYASFTVYPPLEWESTGMTATVVLRIYINGQLSASKKGFLYYADRHPGINVTAAMVSE